MAAADAATVVQQAAAAEVQRLLKAESVMFAVRQSQL
jgi:hypothetical protein